MKNYLFCLFLLLAFSSCGSKQPIMTREDYVEVEVGMKVKELEAKYGKPYCIYSRGESTTIYEYIERITLGPKVLEQRRYYFVISKDRVVGKYMKMSTPPPFESIYSDDPYPNY